MIRILNSSVHQKSLLEKWHVIISNQGKPFAHRSKMAVSIRDRLHNSSFFSKNNTPTIRLSLHCSITMVGGHAEQSEFNTTSTSLSASASASAVPADWLIAPSLWNVRVDTQYVGINEEQKQEIRQLHEELDLVNCVWYRTLPAIATRVRNVLRSSKKVSTSPIDHINQQAVAMYVREAVLPGNKRFQRVGVSGGMIKEVCVRWY